jgi:hypothetical protein
MVVMLRPQANARAVVQPQPSARLLPLRHLQALATPDALHAILAHAPAVVPKQRRDPAIPVTSILAGKIDDGAGKRIFVLAQCRSIALRAAWLVHQPARPALAQALLLSMIHRCPPTLRA